jgi:hypothetical protein
MRFFIVMKNGLSKKEVEEVEGVGGREREGAVAGETVESIGGG